MGDRSTEGMCACGAALPTFVLMHGGKRCDKCRNAPDATGAMDTIIQKLRRSTQPGLAPLYGFTPAEAELMLARLAPEPREQYESGWVIEGAWSPTDQPDYWVGSSAWSTDPYKALRFANQQSAQQAAELMCSGINTRFAMHEWAAQPETKSGSES